MKITKQLHRNFDDPQFFDLASEGLIAHANFFATVANGGWVDSMEVCHPASVLISGPLSLGYAFFDVNLKINHRGSDSKKCCNTFITAEFVDGNSRKGVNIALHNFAIMLHQQNQVVKAFIVKCFQNSRSVRLHRIGYGENRSTPSECSKSLYIRRQSQGRFRLPLSKKIRSDDRSDCPDSSHPVGPDRDVHSGPRNAVVTRYANCRGDGHCRPFFVPSHADSNLSWRNRNTSSMGGGK